jgi:hypothetical protein
MRVFESIKEAIGLNTLGASRPADRLVVVLSSRAAAHWQKLRWQSSIVELMKLFGVDWRLGQRKRLARELGFAGDAGNSLGLNVWLRDAVMGERANSLAPGAAPIPAPMTHAQRRLLRRRFAITNWEMSAARRFTA